MGTEIYDLSAYLSRDNREGRGLKVSVQGSRFEVRRAKGEGRRKVGRFAGWKVCRFAGLQVGPLSSFISGWFGLGFE